ncbi:amidohydrolase family protein [Oceanicola sp. D3]|uniref:dihydroorotase n=1 Tax=Oceanicola sp. D3 TaxID=2587163 RepID=UPI00111DB999|nr:dihydroorotase [Oceanicola sp. D3]QDC07831.1 amidohydrolase family protein [Oceanicola sp. D3]
MTTTLFTNVTLIDPEALTEAPGHLLVKDGIIADVATGPMAAPEGAEVVDGGGKWLAPGIVDLGVKICEPGERHKESFKSAGAAAAAGGVTTLIMRPDTLPAIDSPETLEFVTRRAGEAAPVNIHAMATLTKNREGREMAELSFLKDAGALAFSDGDKVVADTKVLARALSYARDLDALVVGHPQEPTLSKGAAATSGKLATLMGLPAVSPMAERMGVDRDIAMVEMTGTRYHFDQLSAARALPPLERAKANGFDITAGVSIHHLTLNANDITDYRTFFKLKPPLREEEDRLAMVEAVASGLIDVISSMHTPQDEESKRLPFEQAASGAVALETLLPAAMRLIHSGALTLPQLFRALSFKPAARLGLPSGRLAKGAPADLLLFDPSAPFLLDRTKLRSKSKNTPFDGQRMEGRVLGTWVAGIRVFG